LVLPLEIREECIRQLIPLGDLSVDTLHEFEVNQIGRLVSYLKEVDSPHSGAMTNSILQRDFKNFYEQYDRRRGKDFRATFPQLAEWYDTL
jgi:hypothetical protein